MLDGKEFARADCPAFLCGSLVNHPPASTSPNTAFLNIRTPKSSPLLSLHPAPISYDPAALYYPAAAEFGSDSADDVPVVALVTIRNVTLYTPLVVFVADARAGACRGGAVCRLQHDAAAVVVPIRYYRGLI